MRLWRAAHPVESSLCLFRNVELDFRWGKGIADSLRPESPSASPLKQFLYRFSAPSSLSPSVFNFAPPSL